MPELHILLLAASVTDPHQFRSGRQFAAWLGLTPLQKGIHVPPTSQLTAECRRPCQSSADLGVSRLNLLPSASPCPPWIKLRSRRSQPHVRFRPDSNQTADIAPCRFRANRRSRVDFGRYQGGLEVRRPLAQRFVPDEKTSDWSSNSSIGSLLTSTVSSLSDPMPADAMARLVECECESSLFCASGSRELFQ